ncbi:MAG: hypothetical protein K2R98_13725 [Gemmataceae bacterium]|nr:hypothetical protein [Gemmataceae bacterium]
MFSRTRPLTAAAIAAMTLVGFATPRADAFWFRWGYPTPWGFAPYYRPFPVYPYFPPPVYVPNYSFAPSFNPSYSMGDPYSGYLTGSADLTRAQGQYLVNSQQAYLLKEQVRAAQIENRRKAFDEWLYERANTPTLNDERERTRRAEVRRDLNDPPATEIWSGKTLNELLAELQDQAGRAPQGPNVPLDAETLKQINVYPAKGIANAGLLKERVPLAWPVALRLLLPAREAKPLRDRVDALLAEAKAQALKGPVKAETVAELNESVAKLSKLLRQRAGDMMFSQYTESKRFLAELEGAAKVLEQADAADYLNRKFAARGRNVRELIQHMTENGLRFGPARSGDEPAYNALYQVLATYMRDANAPMLDR